MNINLTGVEATANKDIDGTLAANSDTKYPSQKAVKTYADTKQAALGYTAENTANKDATGGYAGLTLFKINFKNAANTFTSFFTNSNTAARTYTFKDADGTIAFTSDITGTNSGTNTGDETAARIGALINGSSAATPNDADLVATAESSVLKKITWTNVKTFLKTYFDAIYQAILTAANVHTFVDSLTAMTTPVDADRMIIVDNSASLAKKITWANIKATLKSYFDTLYPVIAVYEFRAYSLSNQNVSTGTYTKVNFDTVSTDSQSNYSTANKRYTPTKAGTYFVSAQAYMETAASAGCFHYTAIYKNGTMYSTGLRNGSTILGSFTVPVSDTVTMNGTTDYLEVFVWQNNKATAICYGGTSYTFWSANLLK